MPDNRSQWNPDEVPWDPREIRQGQPPQPQTNEFLAAINQLPPKVPLLRADPHKHGYGKIHLMNQEQKHTLCGRTLANCPGTEFFGNPAQITCVHCQKSLLTRTLPQPQPEPAGPQVTRESYLLRQVEKYFRDCHPDIVVRKRHGGPFQTAGDPDLYGCWHGRHFELELKRHGQNPTPLQRERLVQWTRSGALTAIIHSISELQRFLVQLDQLDHLDSA